MRRDRVGIVEAAYHLDLPVDQWLTDVLKAAQPHLDDGLGVVGMVYDASDLDKLVITHTVVVGAPAEVAPEVIQATTEAWPRPIVDATFRESNCCTTSILPKPLRELAYEKFAEVGVADVLVVNGRDPSGKGFFISGNLRNRKVLSPRVRLGWQRVSAHLAAAYRLRRRLARSFPDRIESFAGAEAVFQPSGKVEHAEGEAKQVHRQLQEAVVRLEQIRRRLRRDDQDEALAQWKALVQARWTLVDEFTSEGRRYIVARENGPKISGVEALSARESQAVAFAALGHTNKLIAYEMGITAATVGVLLWRAAAKLGVKSRAELVYAFSSRHAAVE
jgi:DNA-binding CsgD family transcriptional regulator